MIQPAVAVPSVPYRGIQPFRYLDRAIFFARDDEARRLTSLVSVYRGVLLYGDSGAGKSSLVNAGLIPDAMQLGFAPERLRVQPRDHEEFVIERLHTGDTGEDLLPSVLAHDEDASARAVLAVDEFEARVRAACAGHRPLLIFDQFEEIVTLFEEAGAAEAQQRLVRALAGLLRGSLPVKFLFSFREDYLGRIKELLSACPELVDQSMRIAAPAADALPTIIRGPFERYPGHFERPFSPDLTGRLVTVLGDRFGASDISLSEVQTVCLRLWQSETPEALLEEEGAQGILEDYLGEALDSMPTQLRAAAIALLAQMVTGAGTRNVISAGDLTQRVHEQEGGMTQGLLDQALERLSRSRLVRLERRRDLDLYEITSEFLVPWISRRRDQFRRSQVRRRYRRRLFTLGSIAVALLVALALVFGAEMRADHASTQAIFSQTMAEAQQFDASNTPLAAQLDLAAYRMNSRQDLVSRLVSTENTPLSSQLQAGSGAIYIVAYGRSGVMVTGDYDGSLRLWDTAKPGSPRLLSQLYGTSGPTMDSAAFSQSGQLLASGTSSGQIELWDVADPTQPRKLPKQPLTAGSEGVNSLSFSADGQLLASADSGGSIRLWNVADPSHPMPAGGSIASRHQSADAVTFSPSGRTLAVGSADDTIQLWNMTNPKSPKAVGGTLKGGTGAVESLAFSPNGQTLASGDFDTTVRLWNVADPAHPQSLGPAMTSNTDSVNSVAFSPNGQLLASGSFDSTVRLWSVADPANPQSIGQPLTGNDGSVYSVAFSPDSTTVASGTADGKLRLWKIPSTLLLGSTAALYQVVFDPGGGALVSAGLDGMIRAWSVADPVRPARLGQPVNGGVGGIISAAFSPDGRVLAVGGDNGQMRLWNFADPVHPQPLTKPLSYGVGGDVSVAFSPNGKILAGCGYADSTLRLWNVADPGHPKVLGKPLTTKNVMFSVTFSPNGRTLVSGGGDEEVDVWNVAEPARPQHLGQPFYSGTQTVSSVAFTHDGNTLAAGNYDGGVQLWDLADPAEPLKGIKLTGAIASPVNSISFDTDGGMLAAGSDNGEAELWKVTGSGDFQEVGEPLTAASSYINSVAFSPDNHTLATGSNEGVIRLWNLNVGYAINYICTNAAGDLSAAQWASYIPNTAYRPPCAH